MAKAVKRLLADSVRGSKKARRSKFASLEPNYRSAMLHAPQICEVFHGLASACNLKPSEDSDPDFQVRELPISDIRGGLFEFKLGAAWPSEPDDISQPSGITSNGVKLEVFLSYLSEFYIWPNREQSAFTLRSGQGITHIALLRSRLLRGDQDVMPIRIFLKSD